VAHAFVSGGRLPALWNRVKACLLPLALAVIAVFMGACAQVEAERRVRNTSRTFTTVVLDAGHGAHDSGARTRKGTLEKDLALDVTLRIAPKLQAAGFQTVLTRKKDVFVTLDDRVRISDRYESAVFVSIHFNDAGRKQVSGVESYYFSPESKQMAERLVRALAECTGAPNRGPRVARFRVLRTNLNPAVLMECGYITTLREAALIVQPAYREKIAEGIARGIIQQRGGPIVAQSKL
jgi:N-acetylmuramoyl-L-alanine amidase